MAKKWTSIKLYVSFFITTLVIYCLCSVISVKAAVTLPDGAPIDTPYGDLSTVPSSYESTSYYDCLIPYKASLSQIGGEATGCNQLNGTLHKCEKNSYKVGDFVNSETRFNNGSKGSTYKFKRGGSFGGTTNDFIGGVDSDGLQVATTANGDSVYIITLSGFFWNYQSKFENYGDDVIGTLVDIILTDGTCIHAVVGDYRENSLTNGGEGSNHKGYENVTNTTWGCHNYSNKFQPLNYSQYQNIFQAVNGEVFGIYGTNAGGKFMSKYNLSSDGGGNHVAVIRVYNAKINSSAARTTDAGSGVDYSLGGVTIQSMGSNWGSSSLGVAGSNLVAENELVGMPSVFDATKDQSSIVFATRDDLGVQDMGAVSMIGTNIDLLHQATIMDYVRIGITFVGLSLIFYGFLMILALMFDKANNFIDISLLHVITFGGFNYDPFNEVDGKKSPKGYITAKKVIIVSVLVMLAGFLIMSGGFFKIYGNLLFRITEYFN